MELRLQQPFDQRKEKPFAGCLLTKLLMRLELLHFLPLVSVIKRQHVHYFQLGIRFNNQGSGYNRASSIQLQFCRCKTHTWLNILQIRNTPFDPYHLLKSQITPKLASNLSSL